jgi:hypothetical protein
MTEAERSPRLIDWIVCDDVRREMNKKLMFIGVYQDVIGVPTLPFTLSQLCILSKWDISKASIKNFEMRIIQPDKKELGPVIGELGSSFQDKKRTLIQVGIVPFQIPVAGKYEIVMKINKRTRKVGTFEVALMPEGS